MRFKVPLHKDLAFAQQLFSLIEQNVVDLKLEFGPWPDQIWFSGPLGREIHSFLSQKKWDLAAFNPEKIDSPVNKIIFEYSKPLDQIIDPGETLFDQSFHNRTINNFPDSKTMGKILSTYANPSFKIEKKVRPKKETLLTR